MPVLTLIDLSGIQNYIFRSPKLKDIAAASHRIEQFSEPGDLYYKGVEESGSRFIVAAGGNCSFTSNTREAAKEAVRSITRGLLDGGHGLQAVVAIVDYEDGGLARAYKRAIQELQRSKLVEPRNVVEGFPGLEYDVEAPVDSQIRKRHGSFVEPLDFDKVICNSDEESSLMAVVSVDGIGMGRRFVHWLAACADLTDDEFINEFKTWSDAIKEAWTKAWDSAMDELKYIFGSGTCLLEHAFLPDRPLSLKADGDMSCLPCRKIYQGGDDLSFVCDARIGLSLTAILLRNLEHADYPKETPQIFRNIRASAGLVFVRSSYPFSRAVQLADDVRQSAKRRAMEDNDVNPPSAIDWWVNRQGATIRPAPAFDGSTQRPYLLSDGNISWTWLDETALPGVWNAFGESRGKLKDLLAAAEEGSGGAAVRRLLTLRPLDDREKLDFVEPMFDGETGFSNSGTPIIDFGELFDLHYPIRHDNPGEVLANERVSNAQ